MTGSFSTSARTISNDAARADHDRGAQLDRRDAGSAEDLAHLPTRPQMLGEGAPAAEPAEVDDPANAGDARGSHESVCGVAIGLVELPARAHRVHEVDDGVHALERGADRGRPEQVAFDHLGFRRDPRLEHVGAP